MDWTSLFEASTMNNKRVFQPSNINDQSEDKDKATNSSSESSINVQVIPVNESVAAPPPPQ